MYNRRERRKSAFVIVNGLHQFGRWNKLQKEIEFTTNILEDAPIYTYDNCQLMLRYRPTVKAMIVKVVRNKEGKRTLDI